MLLGDVFVVAQQTAKDAAVHTLQTRQPIALFRAHALKPSAGGVAARHPLQSKKTARGH
jgi:hypothetical protein